MKQSYTDLKASLKNINSIVKVIKSETSIALSDSKVRNRHTTIICGSTILLSGYFEQFLKDIIKEYLAEVSNIGYKAQELPDKIYINHIEQGGPVITDLSKSFRGSRSSRFGSSSREDAIRRFNSLVFESPYEILWEAFANTQANPNSTIVHDLFNALGMSSPWQHIATLSSSGHNDSHLKNALDALIQARNQSAHTGAITPTPTISVLEDHLNTIKVIGKGIFEFLKKELTDLKKNYKVLISKKAQREGVGAVSTNRNIPTSTIYNWIKKYP